MSVARLGGSMCWLAASLAAASPATVVAQRADTASPPRVMSMGQPAVWMPYVSAYGIVGAGSDGGALVGAYHPIGSPVTGLVGLGVEAWGSAGGGAPVTGGVRLLSVTRAINLGLGLDWDARAGNTTFVLSWNTALRRGGLFGHGTTMRVDWLPPRDQVAIGVTVPIAQHWAGRTRPKRTGIDLQPPRLDAAPAPRPRKVELTAATAAAIRGVRQAATAIWLYTNFFGDKDESSLDRAIRAAQRCADALRDSLTAVSPTFPRGRSYAEAERVYHESLARAFGTAAGWADEGPELERIARRVLLDDVVLPYDALYGRVKNWQKDISPLTNAARARFAVWIRDSSGIDTSRHAMVAAVNDSLLAIVTAIQRRLVSQWHDSRLIWLPLQLALAPDEYDEQAEVDRLIERATAQRFTDDNALTYVRSSELPLELGRSIVNARDYHVLWIHDYAGTRASGTFDVMGYLGVANAYFPALTRAVQRYDSTGHLTTFFIVLDQNFYEPNGGRLYMTMLEDPLGAEMRLPEGPGRDTLERRLRERQRELREAVARSARLQADARRFGGADWLRGLVKVHVNITQPSDFTFRSHRIVPPIPFLPDNLMRDHRKIAFWDLRDDDPFAGGMILAGAGVGEQYASPTWEDRALLMNGPVTGRVREELRALFRLNGFAPSEIPAPLQARAQTEILADTGPGRTNIARALQVHNEPGFGQKRSSVARAMLYSLAPRGGVIIVPDALWLASPWAGMLAGAALRGCRVYVVAPALANAPSAGFPQMARSYDVLLRLIQLRETFGDQIRAAGGELRVGIFTAQEDVNDIERLSLEVRRGLDRYAWLRELFPFDTATVAVLDSTAALLAAAGYTATSVARDAAPRKPQLHQKTQLIADGKALATALKLPEWRDALAQALIARARQTTSFADPRGVAAAQAATLVPVEALGRAYRAARTDEERRHTSFYFTLGTQNMDPRGLMLDGEASIVVSGDAAALGVVDMWFLMARSTWVENKPALDAHLPPADGWRRRFGRYIRFVL